MTQEDRFRATASGPDVTEREKLSIELWQYFRSRGDLDKERMLTIVMWLLAFVAAVTAYTGTVLFEYTESRTCMKSWIALAIFGIVGLALVILAYFVTKHFSDSARKNWIRSRMYLKDLPDIKNAMDENKQIATFGHDLDPPKEYNIYKKVPMGNVLKWIIRMFGVVSFCFIVIAFAPFIIGLAPSVGIEPLPVCSGENSPGVGKGQSGQ